MEAMNIALSTFALAQSIGGAIGLTTATVRNCSSRILRKIGGRSLGLPGCPLPSYFDPQYGCEMELLRFDSNAPNPKYQTRIDDILSRFFELPVVCARAAMGLVHRDRAARSSCRCRPSAKRARSGALHMTQVTPGGLKPPLRMNSTDER